MTWNNSDKTKWLDLSKVSYWQYNSRDTQEKELEEFRKRHGNIFPTESFLTVIVDGASLDFIGKEADEIYNLLTSKKKLLKG